jgi:TatD DNase family protein
LNAGYLVPFTARAIAEVKGIPVEEVCRVVGETSASLYGPW